MESDSTQSRGLGGARPGSGAPKGNHNAQTHGLTLLKRVVNGLGTVQSISERQQGKPWLSGAPI